MCVCRLAMRAEGPACLRRDGTRTNAGRDDDDDDDVPSKRRG